MRSQFSTTTLSRSRSLLEGKDLVPLGFGSNAGAQAIFAGEVYRPADPVPTREKKQANVSIQQWSIP